MKRLITGLVLAVLVVLGLPLTASAAQNDPYFTLSSTSYSGQPATFSVRIINNLENSKLTASVSGAGVSGSLSCVSAGAVLGLGPWRCTLPGSYRLRPGTLRVTAKASGNGNASNAVTHTASVSGRFGVTGASSPTEGEGFAVSGRYDHIPGQNDFSVRARVTANGSVVAGQSSTACAASNGTFRCSLRSQEGLGTSYSVRVTETHRTGLQPEHHRSINVTALAGPPAAPDFGGQTIFNVAKPPRSISGTSSRSGLRIELLVDPGARPNFSNPTSTCGTSGGNGSWTCSCRAWTPASTRSPPAPSTRPTRPRCRRSRTR